MSMRSSHEEFSDTLHARRRQLTEAGPALRRGIRADVDADTARQVAAASCLLDGAAAALGAAEDELRAQDAEQFVARTEVSATAALYRDLFELAPVAYLLTDDHTRVRYANSAACGLLRAPINALVGRPLAAFVASGERSGFRSALARSASSRDVEEWPVCLVPRGAPAIECRVHVRELRAADGAVHGLSWVITQTISGTFDGL